MSIFVDLKNFCALIGDNKDLKKQLFSDFIEVSKTNIESMHKAMKSGDKDLWTKNAHMMKGASRNLGAQMLADLLAEAEKCADSQKSYYYQRVNTLFDLVQDFLAQEAKR